MMEPIVLQQMDATMFCEMAPARLWLMPHANMVYPLSSRERL